MKKIKQLRTYRIHQEKTKQNFETVQERTRQVRPHLTTRSREFYRVQTIKVSQQQD